jgi:hypothetical protein
MRRSERRAGTGARIAAAAALLSAFGSPPPAQNPETLMGSTTAGTGTEVSCPADYALVGVKGRAGMWINNLFLVCARVNGGTLGDVKELTYSSQRIGGLASGTFTREYAVRCPAGQVAKGVMVYRGLYINQVGLYCRVWTSEGTGSGNLVGPAGGTGGTFDARTCVERTKVVTALHAREGWYVDALGVRCRVP